MDFASGLANLEQTATHAQNRRRQRDNNSGGNDDRGRYQPRPRRDDHRGNSHYHGGRGYHHSNSNSNNHGQDRDLDGLARFGYRLPRGPYHRPPPIAASSSRPFHICLLAITIDDLPYEAIWRAWANNANTSSKFKVSLVCHAKHPEKVTSPWLQQRMLLQPRRIVRGNSLSDPEVLSHRPGWGSVEITRAMIDLLVAAMEVGRQGDATKKEQQDARFSPRRFWMSSDTVDSAKTVEELAQEDVPPVDKFIFISETCLPVTTLEECGKALFATTIRTKPTITETSYSKAAMETAKPVASDIASGDAKKENSTDDKEEEAKAESTTKEENSAEAQEDEKSNNNKPTTTATNKEEEDKVIYLDTSWVNARNFNSPNTPQNKYERDQFSQIHRVVPKRYRWKADQWMVLSRTHAAALLDLDHSSSKLTSNDHLWNSFRRINASDEMYFPTALALAGVLLDTNRKLPWQPPPQQSQPQETNKDASAQQETPVSTSTTTATPSSNSNTVNMTPWLERRKVTYTDWSMGMRNPACFTKGIKDFANIARLARQQNCLFARKFAPLDPATEQRTGDISVEDWTKEMEAIVKQQQADK